MKWRAPWLLFSTNASDPARQRDRLNWRVTLRLDPFIPSEDAKPLPGTTRQKDRPNHALRLHSRDVHAPPRRLLRCRAPLSQTMFFDDVADRAVGVA